VLFTSDHGHYLGAHGLDLKHGALYDEVVNVPMIVSGPSFASGAVSEALLSHIDVLPTLLDIAGVEPPDQLHGRSFRSPLEHGSDQHRDVALVEHSGYGRGRADGDGCYPVRCLVSEDGHKLALNLLETDELYDLDEEPLECTNRITDPSYERVRSRLHDALIEELEATDDPFHSLAWTEREWYDGEDVTVHPG
jgi:uncharacterized sulfatase